MTAAALQPSRSARRPAGMSALSRLLLAFALAVGMAGATTASALACTCAALTEEEAYAAADVVVLGVVVDSDDPFFGPIMSSADPVRYTIAVERVFKGNEVGSQVEVSTARSGASCGLEMSIGQRWRLYAYRDGGLQANLCGGSELLSPGSASSNPVPAGPASVFGLPWMLSGVFLGVGGALVAMILRLLGRF